MRCKNFRFEDDYATTKKYLNGKVYLIIKYKTHLQVVKSYNRQ